MSMFTGYFIRPSATIWETTSFVDDETAQTSFVDHPQN
jgi:hypothetical protein